MEKFLELEAAYLVMGAVILLITLFVTTRPFFKKGAVLKGFISVGMFLVVAIGMHYKITTDRMKSVKSAFKEGKTIICESRATRKVAQTVDVNINKEWVLEGDVFSSVNYGRVFHSARCLVK